MDLTRLLYHTSFGRMLLKPLTSPFVSELSGRILDHPASRILIPGFIAANRIDMDEYRETSYDSFNDFFCRKIRPSLRPVDPAPEHLAAPCDGLLSVYPISQDLVLPVKQTCYTVSSLLRSRKLARRFECGYCMVFRLCVNHYHRYCYPDDGVRSREVRLRGIFHTVRPAALEKVPVFTENTREYCLLKTLHFGTVLQMEVGAMLVGRICNHPASSAGSVRAGEISPAGSAKAPALSPAGASSVKKGQEKGFFQYGGSTVILLLEKDRVCIPERFLHTAEVPVKQGQMVARALPRKKTILL